LVSGSAENHGFPGKLHCSPGGQVAS
jgi:hypothetical protein